MASIKKIKVTLDWFENQRYDAVATVRISLSPAKKGNEFVLNGIRVAKEKKNYRIYYPTGEHRRINFPVFAPGSFLHKRILKAILARIPKKPVFKIKG
jgi:hypothetical protein